VDREIGFMLHLPPVLQNVAEMNLIAVSEDTELLTLNEAAVTILNNGFIETANADGVHRLEAIAAIMPRGTDTISDRKFRILNRFIGDLPYTFLSLQNRLEALCGKNGVSLELLGATYTLNIKVALTAKNQLEEVNHILSQVIPANMIWNLTLIYNQHATLAKLTHVNLNKYTYDNLRNEVL